MEACGGHPRCSTWPLHFAALRQLWHLAEQPCCVDRRPEGAAARRRTLAPPREQLDEPVQARGGDSSSEDSFVVVPGEIGGAAEPPRSSSASSEESALGQPVAHAEPTQEAGPSGMAAPHQPPQEPHCDFHRLRKYRCTRSALIVLLQPTLGMAQRGQPHGKVGLTMVTGCFPGPRQLGRAAAANSSLAVARMDQRLACMERWLVEVERRQVAGERPRPATPEAPVVLSSGTASAIHQPASTSSSAPHVPSDLEEVSTLAGSPPSVGRACPIPSRSALQLRGHPMMAGHLIFQTGGGVAAE
uniref:Uncharacterized protein n=1 Tax=Sphaerodactylus townsendi TaxID=933632 RepID=A0ACB8EJ96_9SAUR